jgi:Fe-S-cluster containining protein
VSREDAKRSPDHPRDLHNQIAEGLLYTHTRLNANTKKSLETASFLYALVELLDEQGLISVDKLDARKEIVAQRLLQRFREDGSGFLLQDHEYDKYAFDQQVEFDCAGRIPLCREGIVQWELGQPYMIAHDGNGTCGHLDPATRACTIWAHRPVPCRAFDCRGDARIWLDFEDRVANPLIYRDDWPACISGQKGGQGEP